MTEKADHILRECPALNQHRWECFGAFQLVGNVEWEVSALTQFLQDERVRTLEDSESTDDGPPPDYTSDEAELR